MSWAAGTVYLKWARLDGDPTAVTAWQLIIGFVIVLACLPIVEGSLHLDAHAGPLIWRSCFQGVVGSGISYFLWFDIVRRLPASTASLGILSVPVVGVIASVVMLGERPTMADIARLRADVCGLRLRAAAAAGRAAQAHGAKAAGRDIMLRPATMPARSEEKHRWQVNARRSSPQPTTGTNC